MSISYINKDVWLENLNKEKLNYEEFYQSLNDILYNILYNISSNQIVVDKIEKLKEFMTKTKFDSNSNFTFNNHHIQMNQIETDKCISCVCVLYSIFIFTNNDITNYIRDTNDYLNRLPYIEENIILISQLQNTINIMNNVNKKYALQFMFVISYNINFSMFDITINSVSFNCNNIVFTVKKELSHDVNIKNYRVYNINGQEFIYYKTKTKKQLEYEREIDNQQIENECDICYCEYEFDKPIAYKLQCSHFFHTKCIKCAITVKQKMINQMNSQRTIHNYIINCPVCRKVISNDDILKINSNKSNYSIPKPKTINYFDDDDEDTTILLRSIPNENEISVNNDDSKSLTTPNKNMFRRIFKRIRKLKLNCYSVREYDEQRTGFSVTIV